MGAAWALENKRILPFTLPKITFLSKWDFLMLLNRVRLLLTEIN